MKTVLTRRVQTIALASSTLLFALVLAGCAASGIRVLVANKAGAPISNMKITYKGGTVTLPSLSDGKTFEAAIKPQERSDLDIEFQLAGGEQKSQKIRAQLESSLRGDVELTIQPGGGVGWEAHLTSQKTKAPKGNLMLPPNGSGGSASGTPTKPK